MSAHTTHHDDCGCLSARYMLRITELEQSEAELEDACDKQFKATVRQRERAEKAEAELAALKAQRCKTCENLVCITHSGYVNCAIGVIACGDGFSCNHWAIRAQREARP